MKTIFFQFEIIINGLDSLDSASFQYLCYGSTAIKNSDILPVRGPPFYVRIWRLQMSDSDVKRSSRAERVKTRGVINNNNLLFI